MKTIVNFPQPLLRQPEFFTVNKDQSICIIASTEDGIYFNQHTGELVDLDKKFQISNIKEIICDSEDHYFYILSNMYQGKLGVFMIRFDEEKPARQQQLLLEVQEQAGHSRRRHRSCKV